MKKIFILLFLIFSSAAFAQWGTAAIKLGHFSPGGAESGFIIGYEGGKSVDYGVNFGWSIDWFHKSYVDKQLVSEFNQAYGIAGGSINELRAKTNLHDFPIMAQLTAKFPVAPFTKVFMTAGVGGEILLIHYRNFENPDNSEFHGAFDFNWRIGGGALYEIGPRSEVFGELTYHASEPSWEYEVKDPVTKTTKTFERNFDMSGFMGRIGFRFYY
jgi:hypothetical protein